MKAKEAVSNRAGFGRACLAFACAIALVAGLCVPFTSAHAMCNFGTVGVSVPGAISMTSGGSTSVSCVLTPASHQQTPNCTTDYCPSGCEFASGGCLDANGQCTCFGSSYSTYYPSATVSSSNPSVARASYANGVVYVDAYSAGTATIAVYGSLRLWTTGVAYMTVTVSDPAPAPSGSGSGTSGAQQPASSGGYQQPSASVAGSVSVSDAGVSASSSTGKVLSALVAGGDAAKVEEGAAEIESGQVSLVHMGDASVAEALAAIAGTDDTVCFWHGDDAETADYMWSFSGKDVNADSVADADLTITQVKKQQESLSAALTNAEYVVLDFAQQGAYPCVGTTAYKVSDAFANGTRLTLYYYDEDTNTLGKVQEGIEVSEGYATFQVSHGGMWVLATDDSLEGPLADATADEPEATAVEASGDEPAQQEDAGVNPLVVVAGVAVVAAIAAGAAYAVRKRKGAVADGAAGEPEGGADAAGDADTNESEAE